MDAIFKDVVEEARSLIGAEITNLFVIVDSETSTTPTTTTNGGEFFYCKYKYREGDAQTSAPIYIPIGRGLVSQAALSKQPAIVDECVLFDLCVCALVCVFVVACHLPRLCVFCLGDAQLNLTHVLFLLLFVLQFEEGFRVCPRHFGKGRATGLFVPQHAVRARLGCQGTGGGRLASHQQGPHGHCPSRHTHSDRFHPHPLFPNRRVGPQGLGQPRGRVSPTTTNQRSTPFPPRHDTHPARTRIGWNQGIMN